MKKIHEILTKYKGYIVCIVIIILSSLSIFIQNIEKNTKSKVNTSNEIAVYVTGEIKNEGVYFLKQNSRLENLIDVAGGLTLNADIDKLNFALLLKDSDKIVIPKKEEKVEAEEESNENKKTSLKININTATKNELMKLSGIGSTYADKIIKYREQIRFDKIEDIMKVEGIGNAKFEKIKDSITVE